MSSDNQNKQSAEPNKEADATTEAKPLKKKGGRKVGYRKPIPLGNGLVTPEKIFLFVERDTIPVRDQQRFLKICDTWINDLGADSLKDTDIEEIALYARERIYIDGVYRTFAEAETIDPNLITQLDKMNKGLEARKENLGARFKDRGVQRKNKDGMSFLSLFENFEENSEDFLQQALQQKEKIKADKEEVTNVEEYMQTYTSGNPLTPKESEDN